MGEFEKSVIVDRYLNLVSTTERDYKRTSILFVVLTNMISISSVFIAVLVAIDRSAISTCTNTLLSEIIFWILLTLSILLALSNKWLYSFNLHKKYIMNKEILEKFYSEGWTFIVGNGKYKSCRNYTDRYKLFCLRIEQIRTKSVKGVIALDGESSELLASGTLVLSPRKRGRRSRHVQQRDDDTEITQTTADSTNSSNHRDSSVNETERTDATDATDATDETNASEPDVDNIADDDDIDTKNHITINIPGRTNGHVDEHVKNKHVSFVESVDDIV